MPKKINSDEQAEDPKKRRLGIQSVEIGLSVLETLVKLATPSALTTISQNCGLAPPQTHRYLSSLINAGMASQDPATGKYSLGPQAARLGLSALAMTDLFKAADFGVENYSRDSGATVLIAALGPGGPTVIRWHAGIPPVVTSLSIGSTLPLLRSATGLVFLAFTPEREYATVIARETAMMGFHPVDVAKARAGVLDAGHAEVHGLVIPGLRASAYPIFDNQGRAALVATLITTETFTASVEADLREGLRVACEHISAAVGGAPIKAR
jgi:DNA-binding IclR family transcriptional regulator